MRIIINGFAHGGNCPPYVKALKKYNKDTILINVLSCINGNTVNYEYLSNDDIQLIELSKVERILILILKKIRLPFWKYFLIYHSKELIKVFKPDIIINHRASINAEIMLKTGFRPQLTLIYGSEAHNNQIKLKILDYIFQESIYVLTTTNEMSNHLIENRKDWKNKIRVSPWGYFEMDKVLDYKKSTSKVSLKKKYGFKEDEIIFFDSRSLRGLHSGFHAIIEAVKSLIDEGYYFKIIFLKGYLGTQKMVDFLKKSIEKDSYLQHYLILEDKVVSNQVLFDYYYISDAFISLLPFDQFGLSILDAVFFDCSLILFEINTYVHELGCGPYYLKDHNIDNIKQALKDILEGKTYRVSSDVLENIKTKFDPSSKFKDIYNLLNDVVQNSQQKM